MGYLANGLFSKADFDLTNIWLQLLRETFPNLELYVH